MFRDAESLLERLGMAELPSVRTGVSRLSIGHQQLVEIARALSREARILVLDEPTSALSEAETEALFATLEQLRRQGTGIIYISHRLEEITRIADRITVLRDGRSVGTQDASRVNAAELVRWMVGRDIVDHFHRPPQHAGAIALEVRQLRNDRVDGVSFELRHGEVLGIAGLVGSGRTELARTIFGITPMYLSRRFPAARRGIGVGVGYGMTALSVGAPYVIALVTPTWGLPVSMATFIIASAVISMGIAAFNTERWIPENDG